MNQVSRRRMLTGGFGLLGAGVLAGGAPAAGSSAAPSLPGRALVEKTLVAQPATLDLGGLQVDTWAYGDTVPGPLIRATAGDRLRITVDNQLPAETTVHWHGIALEAAADGVPGLTQDPIATGSTYTYDFTAPDPGTYFYHPHVGLQLDRALYAPLIIDDPKEPGCYDHEWVLVLDDWLDGTGRTPEDVLQALTSSSGSGAGHGGMTGMDHGDIGMSSPEAMGGMDHAPMKGGRDSPYGEDAGDVTYPHYLVNGKAPEAPDVLAAKPGDRVRLRIINAAADTIFTVALGGHRMEVTHTDGFPVKPQETDALAIGMGERYDAIVTIADGVFPFVAAPMGKDGQAMALIRTGSGAAPAPTVTPKELRCPALIGAELEPADSARLETRDVEVALPMALTGQMDPYQWGFNGAPYGKNDPLIIREGQRVQLDAANQTMMAHPLHVHGHTFALPNGLRKDTVMLAPMQSLALQLQADNPGDWMVHCHNLYHGEAGMMIEMRYRR